MTSGVNARRNNWIAQSVKGRSFGLSVSCKGPPQVSVLGSLQFLTYTKDTDEGSENPRLMLSDNVKLLKTANTGDIQRDLDKV